jgi:hypothetical protein
VTEPSWKTELRKAVNAWVLGPQMIKGGAYAEFERHVEAAYQRGLQAGKSQAGYSTRRKQKEGEACRTGTAGAAGNTPASNTETGEP